MRGALRLAKTTLEDVVKESGCPGRRSTVSSGGETNCCSTRSDGARQLLHGAGDHVRDAPDLVQLLEQASSTAQGSVAEHVVLRKILDTEPERLLPLLTVESAKTLPFIADS